MAEENLPQWKAYKKSTSWPHMRKNRFKQMIKISVILPFLHIRRMMWAQQKMIDRNYV